MDADTRTIILIDDDVAPERAVPAAMQEILAIDKRMARTTRKLEAEFANVETKIHRFPRGLRGIDDGDGGRYIAPSVVAIGPYHHGAARLQEMEEVKLAAAYHLCRSSGHSTAKVYERVLSVAGAARGCYDAGDPSVEAVGEADFAAMMFIDGCFLLQYMVDGDDAAPVLRNRMALSTGPSIQKDIFLLENQIPWLVLEALAEFISVDGHRFVHDMGAKFLPGKAMAKSENGRRRLPWPWRCTGGRATKPADRSRGGEQQYKPAHLLGLLRFTQVGSMPEDMVKYKAFPLSLSSSAVELAEIGVVPTPSTEPWFGDARVRRCGLAGELLLSPVFLSEVTACWLVNMAALEASTAGASGDSDGFVVSSYLSVLAMLEDRKEDVHELRRRRVLHGALSNKQALGFFKGLGQHLRFGGRYFAALEEIDSYKRHRSLRIAAHKFVYNNYRFIAAFLSVTGVLIGIFKTLLSLKR
ncbi:UPF0481 protein At3g47200-like [Panicum virgatum]|uniref:Uncharacterized protein n=1 Tax=Panicum virgatum TaxID=38727 RepID=A0A8T0QTR8_PANVG|nr:UPF0481 protein At3g47200-like [Panicum virgatum]KAG2576423.1 hypothetical protein PVAP13_6NG019400 [Panicum virgatum]